MDRQDALVDRLLRGSTRIFRPEVYEKAFPPTEIEKTLLDLGRDEGEEITADDFDSIDQFIKGLGDIKSRTIMSDDEGWV